ncbi:MAG: hypothetical protein KC620_06455 [Myxococcales bacterium]|nr:hypothetical protein [Myxococcales bacterium]
MNRVAPLLVLGVALAACDSPVEPIDGPLLAIERYVPAARANELLADDGPADCYAVCPGAAALPPEALVTREPCGALRDEACALRGGADRLRVTAWYAGLDFERPSDAPATEFDLLLDGEVVDPNASVTRYFHAGAVADVGFLTLPPRAAAELRVRAQAVGEAGFAALSGAFSLGAPLPTLLIARCPTPGAACGALAHTGDLAIQYRGPTGLAEAATVITRLDGVPDQHYDALPLTTEGGEAVLDLAVPVPDTAARATWHIEVVHGDLRVGRDVTLTPPALAAGRPLRLEVSGCTAPCAANVGRVVATLFAPAGFGDNPLPLVSAIDGEAPDNAIDVTLVADGAGGLVGAVSLAVPDAPGTTWRLSTSGASFRLERSFALVDPPLSVTALACPAGAACRVAAGTPVDVQVRAPAGLNASSAAVRSLINGRQLDEPIDLHLGRLGDEKVGTLQIVAPDAAGAVWQLAAQVGETEVQSGPITLDPAP